jgi:alpha-D-xyloside xylohydrolase
MPYLFAKAVEAHETGVPMMRAMLLEFPDDPACHTLDRQYLLGESLMVAPVLHDDGHVEYYVPEGNWTNYITGDVITGPRWVRETHGFLSTPLLVRPNSIIAVGANNERPDYDYADGVIIRVYQLADGKTATAVIPTIKGEAALTITATRTGNEIKLIADGDTKNWSAQLMGMPSIASVDGGSTIADSKGIIVLFTSS